MWSCPPRQTSTSSYSAGNNLINYESVHSYHDALWNHTPRRNDHFAQWSSLAEHLYLHLVAAAHWSLCRSRRVCTLSRRSTRAVGSPVWFLRPCWCTCGWVPHCCMAAIRLLPDHQAEPLGLEWALWAKREKRGTCLQVALVADAARIKHRHTYPDLTKFVQSPMT